MELQADKRKKTVKGVLKFLNFLLTAERIESFPNLLYPADSPINPLDASTTICNSWWVYFEFVEKEVQLFRLSNPAAQRRGVPSWHRSKIRAFGAPTSIS